MRFLLSPTMVALLAFPAAAAEGGADPFRILPAPSGCAVVFDGVGGEYRLDRLVDGGVTLGLYATRLAPQEKVLSEKCLTHVRISSSYDGKGTTVDLRPSGYEFSSLLRTGESLTILFEKVVELGARSATVDHSYRVGVGDQIEIVVYAHDDLSKKWTVGPDGTIDYPLLGSLRTAGLTARELQEKLTSELGRNFIVNPQVSVEVLTYKSQFAYVTGAVKNPGKVPLEGRTMLKDALSVVGGFAPDAGYAISVARRVVGADGIEREPEKLTYSRSDIESGLANLFLQPNDVVSVSEKDFFYIQAEVRKPGKYELEPGQTLLQAIAVAEGLTDWADRKEIAVISNVGGRTVRKTVNLKDIERQKAPDVLLSAGDIIIVPRRIL